MKPPKSILLLLAILISINLHSQKSSEKVVTIHQPQSYRLVSKSRAIVGTKSKIVLDVQLPKNTVKWFYAVSASRNEDKIERNKQLLNIAGQLTKIIDQSGTTKAAMSILTAPPSENHCDIFLFSSQNDANIFESASGEFSYIRNGSRPNYEGGVVDVTSPDYCVGTQYIGIANQDMLYGLSVTIEVVAVVLEGWMAEDKQKLHDAIYTLMISNNLLEYIDESQVQELTTCMLNKFTNKFTLQDLEHKAGYEIELEFSQMGQKCGNELGFDDIIEKRGISEKEIDGTYTEPSRELLIGTWRDNNSVFNLKRNGDFYIQWDDRQQIWGKWAFEKGKFYLQMGKGQQYIHQKIISFSKNEFQYQAIGDEVIYTAKRIN